MVYDVGLCVVCVCVGVVVCVVWVVFVGCLVVCFVVLVYVKYDVDIDVLCLICKFFKIYFDIVCFVKCDDISDD